MRKIRNITGGGVIFFCPGCEGVHAINSSQTGLKWTYNGNPDSPTFSPSIDYKSGHYVPGEDGKDCWCTFEERFPKYKGRKHPVCYHCHSFVTDGRIQFLGDCTHALAGQTVPIPEWPYAPGTYGGIDEPGEVRA